MDGYGDEPPRRLLLLVGGVALCVAVSTFTGVAGVVSAFAASITDGVFGTPPVEGVALVDEMVEFLIGVVIAAVVLGLIWLIVDGFDG